MSIPTIHAGARFFRVNTNTAAVPGHPYIEIGVAGTNTLTSTMMVQFTPSVDFAGDFAVLGRTMGTAADANDIPFIPVPYRVVSLNDEAQGYEMSSALIAGSALIQIPANGLSLVLLNGLTAGEMKLTMWDVSGSSAV